MRRSSVAVISLLLAAVVAVAVLLSMHLLASSVSVLATGDPAAPSVLSATIPVQETTLDTPRILLTGAATIILLLIVGFPSVLIARSLGDQKNYERVCGPATRWWNKARKSLTVADLFGKTPGWLHVVVGLTLAIIIASFVDPGFGFSLGSLRLLASVGIALVIQNILGWWLVRRALRLTEADIVPRVQFRFASLVILLIAVIVSRSVGFEPGMVFGLLMGMTFGIELAAAKQAKVVMIGVGYAFALSMIGWLLYSMIRGVGGENHNYWITFTSETFSGLAVSGIASLPIVLLPLAFFDGGVIYAWRRVAWAVAYGIALFSFFVILMPLPFSWHEVSAPLTTLVALYVAYAVLATAVWGWLRFSAHGAVDFEPAESEIPADH